MRLLNERDVCSQQPAVSSVAIGNNSRNLSVRLVAARQTQFRPREGFLGWPCSLPAAADELLAALHNQLTETKINHPPIELRYHLSDSLIGSSLQELARGTKKEHALN